MNFTERAAAARAIHAKARHFRGLLINHVAVIERELAEVIEAYEHRNGPLNVPAPRSLEQKRVLVTTLLKEQYPSFLQREGCYLQDLQKIQQFRNKPAHSCVDVSPTALSRAMDHGIGFAEWNDGAPVTDEDMDAWCARAMMVSSTLWCARRLFQI